MIKVVIKLNITSNQSKFLHFNNYRRAVKSVVQFNKLRHDFQIFKSKQTNISRRLEVQKISNEEKWIS